MKISNPNNIDFPFNVNSQAELNKNIKMLKKMGYERIQFNKWKILANKFPLRFTCLSKDSKKYLIY